MTNSSRLRRCHPEATLSIFTNATLTTIFRQDADPAKRLGTVVDGRQQAHVQRIK